MKCTEFGVRGMHDCLSPVGHELLQRKCALSSVEFGGVQPDMNCSKASVHLNIQYTGLKEI